jgi:putative heme-binding domain-containing protein
LEVALPEKLAPSSLAERLKHASAESATSLPAEFLGVDWTETARTGNAEHGRRLFSADGLGCAKCHAIMPHQKGGGGPSLAGALGRLTVSHVVESVLLPSKQVAPVFGTTTIVTAEGQTFAGLVVEENDQQVVLLLPTAVHQSVAKRGIEGRQLQAVSPMPSGLVKTPDELRDLLAYLLSPNPLAP